jgi:hypothetical protein
VQNSNLKGTKGPYADSCRANWRRILQRQLLLYRKVNSPMSMEYEPDEELWAQADAFRAMLAPDAVPPIDVICIVEVDNEMPTPRLQPRLCEPRSLAE